MTKMRSRIAAPPTLPVTAPATSPAGGVPLLFEPPLLFPEPEEPAPFGEVPVWPEPDPAAPAPPVAVVGSPEEDEDETDVKRVGEDRVMEFMSIRELLPLQKPVDMAEADELFEAMSRLLMPVLLTDAVPMSWSAVRSEVIVM